MLSVPCPSCKKPITADASLRFPPWCRACGVDVKVTAEDLEKAKPVPPPASPTGRPDTSRATAAAQTTHRQPPFFHARFRIKTQRLYRIYLLAGEILFLDRTPYQASPELMVAGAMGGLIGALAVSISTKGARERANARLRDMDYADENWLRVMVDENEHSFRSTPDDVFDVRIDPASDWKRWSVFTPTCAGTLTFRHMSMGMVTAELPDVADVRRAMTELPAILGEQVQVNVVWDGGRQRYVAAA